ncbi:SDR family oxidoreductase [Pseudonocardiaceae bacterium YIM PH 21723]|nr:SDR family oxidoreductase [Pseudonocardiaceae bacterium YIM PH 21723]
MSDAPVTLITGGSTGIGATVAEQLLKLGHRVAVTGRTPEKLDTLATGLGNPEDLLTLPGDAADNDAVEAAVRSTVDRFGRLDHAVANAGFGDFDTVADGDPGLWRDMVLTNVLGPALLIRAALPELRKTKGRIVLVGSVGGYINIPGSLYGATKWAVTGLAENTRRLVTADGVGVTLISPGRTETPFFDRAAGLTGPFLPVDRLAETMVWAIRQPEGVDVTSLVVRPIGQPH